MSHDLTAVAGYPATDDGTSNAQRISATPFSHTVDRTLNQYYMCFRSGSTASTAHDTLFGLQLNVTDPGPRNV